MGRASQDDSETQTTATRVAVKAVTTDQLTREASPAYSTRSAPSAVKDLPPTVNTEWGESSASVVVESPTIKTPDESRLSLVPAITTVDLSAVIVIFNEFNPICRESLSAHNEDCCRR